jgi:hypothetical protein
MIQMGPYRVGQIDRQTIRPRSLSASVDRIPLSHALPSEISVDQGRASVPPCGALVLPAQAQSAHEDLKRLTSTSPMWMPLDAARSASPCKSPTHGCIAADADLLEQHPLWRRILAPLFGR